MREWTKERIATWRGMCHPDSMLGNALDEVERLQAQVADLSGDNARLVEDNKLVRADRERIWSRKQRREQLLRDNQTVFEATTWHETSITGYWRSRFGNQAARIRAELENP